MKKIKINKQFSASLKNIQLSGRIVRFFIATALLLYGLYYFSVLALILSGYTYYEVFARWCGFYALIGKNECPLN